MKPNLLIFLATPPRRESSIRTGTQPSQINEAPCRFRSHAFATRRSPDRETGGATRRDGRTRRLEARLKNIKRFEQANGVRLWGL